MEVGADGLTEQERGAQKERRAIPQWEINAVAEAISEEQGCGDCAGTSKDTRHCRACEKEAEVAIIALREARAAKRQGGK